MRGLCLRFLFLTWRALRHWTSFRLKITYFGIGTLLLPLRHPTHPLETLATSTNGNHLLSKAKQQRDDEILRQKMMRANADCVQPVLLASMCYNVKITGTLPVQPIEVVYVREVSSVAFHVRSL